MTTAWKDTDWQTARIHAGAAFINNWWIKMGVCYGYANAPGCTETRHRTEHLLAELTQRIVYQAQGPRVICGDFNQSSEALRHAAIWRTQGFIEIQELALQRWGRPVTPTCQDKTITDYVWVSRELWPYITAVHTDAALWAELSHLDPPRPIPIWRKPLSLPWEELPPKAQVPDFCVDSSKTSTQQLQAIFGAVESGVDNTLRSQGKKLLPQQRGRCHTTGPKAKQNIVAPVKRSRPGDHAITFHGEHWQHTQWRRQLRRIQSYVRLAASPFKTEHIATHRRDLWLAIRRAPGFPQGFITMWKQLSKASVGPVPELPLHPPDAQSAQQIFQIFADEFAHLEQLLIQERVHRAKERRLQDPNMIFRDLAKPKAMPIQMLVRHTTATVMQLSADHCQVT